jgi:DNA-binding transcriptional ArsR family regulator
MLADKQAELDARIQAGRRELDKLSKQLAPLSQQRADLLAELDALQGQVKGARLSNLGDIGGNERPDLDKANAKRLSKKEQAMQRLLAYVAEHPDATLAEIGEAIGRSRSTVGNYVSELRDAGALHKNGQGWETDAIA